MKQKRSYVLRDVIYLKNGTNDYKRIPLQSITFIEVGVKYAVVRTETGDIYTIRKSLKQIVSMLQPTPYLIRISQHYIINANRIIRFSKSDFKLWIKDVENPFVIGRAYASGLFLLLPHTI